MRVRGNELVEAELQGSLKAYDKGKDVFCTAFPHRCLVWSARFHKHARLTVHTQHDCLLNKSRLVNVHYLEEQTWVETLDGSLAAVPLAQMNLTIAATAQKLH